MLRFENIELNNENVESMGDVKDPIFKSFLLIFSDNELRKESLPKLEKALDEHDFAIENEEICFHVYYNDYLERYTINMTVCYSEYESEGDSKVLDSDTVTHTYRPIFEEFYKKNKPY